MESRDRIGEYLVKRLIGEGGMGKVYEAEERLSKRRVALKVLRPELTRHEDGRRLFLNEMQILAHLEHPNLVRSLSSMEVDGQLVLVLEYLSGRTLRAELTRRGTLPWHEALEHVVRIAEALTVAHEQEPPIVHRDLKPENVMLTAPEDDPENAPPTGLKVMDFGIARIADGSRTRTGLVLGTPSFMSPEQLAGLTVDGRSDLYSLGAMVYQLLTGHLPHESDSLARLMFQIANQAPADVRHYRPGLPEALALVLALALEKRPELRYASGEQMAQDLDAVLAQPAWDATSLPMSPADIPTEAVESADSFAQTVRLDTQEAGQNPADPQPKTKP